MTTIDFFINFLDKMEIFTGIKQKERLQAKGGHFRELVDECAKAADQFPLKEEIAQKVLFDAMQTDQDFIGLNVKWVRKILNLYCQVHGVTKDNQREEVVDLKAAYQRMINFWEERKDLDIDGARHKFATENYIRVSNGEAPIDDIEAIKILGSIHSKQISEIRIESIDNPKGSGTRLRENIEKSVVIQKFVIDEVEVYAKTEEEARAMRNQIS